MKLIKCAMSRKMLKTFCCSALTVDRVSKQSPPHTHTHNFEGKVQQFFKIPLSCHFRMEAWSLRLGIGAVVGVNRLVSDLSGSLLTAFPPFTLSMRPCPECLVYSLECVLTAYAARWECSGLCESVSVCVWLGEISASLTDEWKAPDITGGTVCLEHTHTTHTPPITFTVSQVQYGVHGCQCHLSQSWTALLLTSRRRKKNKSIRNKSYCSENRERRLNQWGTDK